MVAPPATPASALRSSPAPVNGKTKNGPQSAPGTLNGPPSGNNHAIPLSARRAEPLDMSKVEQRGQHFDAPRKRANGISDAPTFRPTEDEFKDPMEYMRKIAPEGRKYGIVKIIPPDSWKPTFAINTERFHFRTRRQELSSVEGSNRVNNDYLDQLAKFHKTHGHSLNRFPSVDKRPLDLYRLKKTVERKGGFEAVCKVKKWAEVGRDLGYSGKIMSSLSTSLKNSYQKWLLPYEDYLRSHKPGVQHHMEMMNGGPFTPSPGPSPAKKSQVGTPLKEEPVIRASSLLNASINDAPTPGFTAVNSGGFTPVNVETPSQSQTPQPMAVTTLKRQHSDVLDDGRAKRHSDVLEDGRHSKRLRRDTPTIVGSNMHPRVARTKERTWKPGEVCEGCARSGDTAKIITCDSCECAWHMYCLDQPLKQRPEFEWHCPRCLVGTNEYGFEEGDVYSLSAFQRKAEEFKASHFAGLPRQHNPLNEHKLVPTEEDVEREFWRLVDDINDTVEVEYGADIHSTTHGSGFPTIEKQPRDSYSSDPWNLNILPLDKESLFRHIKSDISGMTVPWLYVGMVFSTFCWHNEDHFSYSANYQHFGATKTWYGIPGDDSYNFEAALRDEVPELFEMQPDLLFQLVTLAKPEKLQKAGVRVYGIDQHAGEFIITYPRAYHAGFNHGFNFNEAVNFAPPDWESFGEEGVCRLRDYRKQPCFSHDELLLTAAAGPYNIKTAKWLAPALERIRDKEIHAREFFRKGGHTDEPQDIPDDEEVICFYCKTYCYLSRLVCVKTGKTVCLLHAGSFECCDVPEAERYSGPEHIMCHRMSDHALETIVTKAVEKSRIPETWSAKVDAELLDNPAPSLKHLRTLLSEGDKVQYELPQLPDLKRFVERCNEWVEEATSYITRKSTNRRKEKVPRKKVEDFRNVDNLRKLLEAADTIGFDCPEITTLRERASSIEEFRQKATEALRNVASKTLQEFEDLINDGREFHVDIPEIDQLEMLVKRLRWDTLAMSKRPTLLNPRQEMSLNDLERLIREGLAIGVPENNPDILWFQEQKHLGEVWEQKAQELMSAEPVNFQQLDVLSNQAGGLPVTAETLARIDAILKKQREVQEKIMALYEQTKDPDFRKRPMYRDVRDVMANLEGLQSKPPGTVDLEKEQKRHEDWMRRGKKLFGKANAPLHILHQHMQIVETRNEACFDLNDKPRMPVEPSSRANTPDHADAPVFCICRRPEAGMMIECELCHEWYHGKCLKIARGKVKEDDKYTCPICDWRVKIPRDAARPKLEDLQQWQDELETLPFQPEEEQTLNNITEHGQAFRDFLRPYINPITTTPDEVGTLRFHLRKIEGADILLATETNYLKTELHKWAPVAPYAPVITEVSMSTRKPRPTKQQKIMAQLGITNPDDLPQQYKIKPHVAKRKEMKPLQPAGPAPLSIPAGAAKPGLTALAIQVLGSLAGNAVALKMLAAEPHMNREKLDKMKVLLTADPDLNDDVETFSAKMAAIKAAPSYTADAMKYDPAKSQSPSVQQYQDSTIQQYQSPNVQQYQSPATPFMFEGGMFETPDAKATPDYGGRPGAPNSEVDVKPSPDFGTRTLFASPKQPNESVIAEAALRSSHLLQSPGLDDSQNINFAEMVNEDDDGEKMIDPALAGDVTDAVLDPAMQDVDSTMQDAIA